MDLEVGKSYRIKTGQLYKLTRIHIDNVIENPIYKFHDERLIIYRVWNKSNQVYIWFIEPYWQICIRNEWEYKIR